MKNTNVNILGTGIFYPSVKIENMYFIQHFKKMGIDVERLLNYTGRKQRYVCADENETVITMGLKAAQEALQNAGISAEELDIIVFATDTPEYTVPCNALKINHYLGAKNANVVYDLNTNCVGLLVAMDQVSKYLKADKKLKKALLIGSEKIFSVARENDPVIYPNLGEGAAAVVLESIEEPLQRGFIDSVYYTDANHHNMALMPACGYSKMYSQDVDTEFKRMWTDPAFTGDFIPHIWSGMISRLLEANDIARRDVDDYLFSQFCKAHINEALSLLEVDSSKYTFVGDEFGYTGVASPIFALHRSLHTGKVKTGSTLVFCSVGSGFSSVALLWKL